MHQILNHLQSSGLILSLKPDGSGLAYQYDSDIFDALSPEQVEECYALIDNNEAALIAYFLEVRQGIIAKLQGVSELAQRLLGQEVELLAAKVVKVSELAIVFEANGLLWQIDNLPQYEIGQIWKISAHVVAYHFYIDMPCYVALKIITADMIGEEAF